MRALYLTLGFLSLAIGILALFVPVLPTTPFVLLAAYFFSKSSERFHRWLLNHRYFGPMVRDWEANRVIPLRAKIVATGLTGISILSLALFVKPPLWALLSMIALVGAGLAYAWSRPSHRGP